MQRFRLSASDLPLNVTVMANVLADRIARRDVARLTPSQAAVTVRGAVLAEVGLISINEGDNAGRFLTRWSVSMPLYPELCGWEG